MVRKRYLLGTAMLALSFMFNPKESVADNGDGYRFPPITYSTPESRRRRLERNAFSLMQLLSMHTNDTHSVSPEWVCPTSICVNATAYAVCTNFQHGMAMEFDIKSSSNVVAKGFYTLENDAYKARIAAFGGRAQTSMRLELFARAFRLVPLDTSTNSFAILQKRQYYPWETQVAAFGRAWIEIETQTNALEFVTAIMNAGYEAARNQ